MERDGIAYGSMLEPASPWFVVVLLVACVGITATTTETNHAADPEFIDYSAAGDSGAIRGLLPSPEIGNVANPHGLPPSVDRRRGTGMWNLQRRSDGGAPSRMLFGPPILQSVASDGPPESGDGNPVDCHPPVGSQSAWPQANGSAPFPAPFARITRVSPVNSKTPSLSVEAGTVVVGEEPSLGTDPATGYEVVSDGPESPRDPQSDSSFVEGTSDSSADPQPWWLTQLAASSEGKDPPLRITLDQLAVETVRHSEMIQALRILHAIRETQVDQSAAEFDLEAFLEARWFDRDEPISNFLTTGGPPRFLEETTTENIGLRKKTELGGSLEIAQRLQLQDSNSIFFTPKDQAQTRLTIRWAQPLLRGAGREYNCSLVILAEHESQIAWNEFAEGLQNRLLEVAKEYWALYYERALVLQRQRNLERAQDVRNELQGRETVDVLQSQLERAKAKVATRTADLARAHAGVRNAETRLRALVNSPLLASDTGLEIVPADLPTLQYAPTTLAYARQTALTHRPEINRLLWEIQAASQRLFVAENEILPSLSLILEAYLDGINDRFDTGRALERQFVDGAPSYTAGIALEVPIGNCRARAMLRQRQLELEKLYRELNAAMAELGAEVEIAVREVEVTHAELKSRYASLLATQTEVDYLEQRWRRLPGFDQSASFLLEDLLDAEDRLVDEEQRVAAAQVGLAIAQAELQHALGTLVVADIRRPKRQTPAREPDWKPDQDSDEQSDQQPDQQSDQAVPLAPMAQSSQAAQMIQRLPPPATEPAESSSSASMPFAPPILQEISN